MKRIPNKYDLGVRFKRGISLASILSNTKLDEVPMLMSGGVIYRQPCEDYCRVYVGETSRGPLLEKGNMKRMLGN